VAENIIKKMGLSTGVLTGQDVKIRRNPRDMSFLYIAVLSSIALVCLVFAFLWTRVTVVNTGYDISKANATKAALIEQNKRLRIEFMKLKSPERIEKIASTELDLVHPTGEQIVKIR
jgi:cell division protein FtsL